MGCGLASTRKSPSSRFANLSCKNSLISCSSFIKVSTEPSFDRDQIVRKLGSGAYSSVFLYESQKSTSRCALKMIPKAYLTPSMLDKDFKLKEAKILSELDHPNIIKCFGAYEKKRNIVMLSEYMPGGTLIDYLQNAPFGVSEKEVSAIIRQILSALVYCHDRGIVHRDVKLENVFVSNYTELHVKLADFGLAIVKKKEKNIKGLAGTLIYMAPEVLNKDYDEKADIWSLGILLFMIATGKQPYHPRNIEEMKKIISIGPLFYNWADTKELSTDLFSFIDGLLKSDPSERLSARQALNHIWIKKYLKPETQPKFSLFLNKIKTHLKLTLLQKSIAVYIIWNFVDCKYFYEISQLFKYVDKDGNGTIDKSELQSLMTLDDLEFVEIFFDEFDLNRNGLIEFTEFALAFCEKEVILCEKNLKRVFDFVDTKKKGFVSQKELLRLLGVQTMNGQDKEMIEFKNKHKISYEDFKNQVKINKTL